MLELQADQSPEQHMVLAIDTADMARAEDLAQLAHDAGALAVKLGFEFMYAYGPEACAELAADFRVPWIADFKLHDIPNTTARAVENIVGLPKSPIGITIHTKSGVKSLRAAQEIAEPSGIMLFGVTQLTSIDDDESLMYEKAPSRLVVWRESRRAVAANIGGLVCSGKELGMIRRFRKTRGLYTLVPGTRSEGEDTHDQARSVTPAQAIQAGADLLVVGRQVTEAKKPREAFKKFRNELGTVLEERAAA